MHRLLTEVGMAVEYVSSRDFSVRMVSDSMEWEYFGFVTIIIDKESLESCGWD